MNLAGKTVLLTGGTAGIGQEIARQLKVKGADVTLTGRNPERLAAMEAEGFAVIAADLSHAAGVDALIEAWGGRPLDLLINNAGMGATQDFRTGSPDPDGADACFYANLSAPVRIITHLMPLLQVQPAATIVNVTSGLALAPSALGSVYCATKAALRSFTFSLRSQLKGSSITVIEALPPMVETQMTDGQPGTKISAAQCAATIVDAIEADREVVYIGQVRLLKFIQSLSPALARRIMLSF